MCLGGGDGEKQDRISGEKFFEKIKIYIYINKREEKEKLLHDYTAVASLPQDSRVPAKNQNDRKYVPVRVTITQVCVRFMYKGVHISGIGDEIKGIRGMHHDDP